MNTRYEATGVHSHQAKAEAKRATARGIGVSVYFGYVHYYFEVYYASAERSTAVKLALPPSVGATTPETQQFFRFPTVCEKHRYASV